MTRRTGRRPVIVVSGYTAAGKTTHARLLSKTLDVPLYSASDLLRSVLKELEGVSGEWGERWSPNIDAARLGNDVDKIVDHYMREAVRYCSGGVFDATYLPWIYSPDDVVNLWIDSDKPSRVRKCVVSHLGAANLSLAEADAVVTAKDSFSRQMIRRRYGARFHAEEGRFDIVVSNSDLIARPTLECAAQGITAFAPLVLDCILYILGEGDAPDSPRAKRLVTRLPTSPASGDFS